VNNTYNSIITRSQNFNMFGTQNYYRAGLWVR
jgi:hypothetical protein